VADASLVFLKLSNDRRFGDVLWRLCLAARQ